MIYEASLDYGYSYTNQTEKIKIIKVIQVEEQNEFCVMKSNLLFEKTVKEHQHPKIIFPN